MSYVLVGILFLLIAGGFVTYLMLTATKRSSPAQAADHTDRTAADRDDTGAPGIGADDTPLGDTAEHAGETSPSGETVGGQDAETAGGTGRPVLSGDDDRRPADPAPPPDERRFQRDPVGGEAEGRPYSE